MSPWRLLCLAALFSGFASPHQDPADPTLDQILERMEKAAAAARGSTFGFLANTPWPGAMAHRVDISVARDGTVRIQQPGPNAGRYRFMVLSDSGLFDIYDDLSSLAHVSTRHSVRRSAERFTPADVDRIDPFSQNSGGGAWIPWAWHVWLHALAPQRAFRYERNLKVAGRRRVEGEECFVLLSGRPLDYVTETSQGTRGYEGQRRKFFVRTSDYSLKRVVEILQWPKSSPMSHETDFGAPDRGIPANFQPPGANDPITIDDIRRGLELDAASLLPPSGDLYATKARFSGVPELLSKSPDDPDLLFSEAILDSHKRYGGEQKAKPFDEKFTRIVGKSWTPTPVRNLLSLLADTGDFVALKSLLTRVDADPAMAKAAALERALGWMQVDDLAKAAAALKESPDPEAHPLPIVRVELALRRGDFAGAVSEYEKWPLPPGEWGQSTRAGRLISTCRRIKELSYEALFNALDSGIAARPSSVALHMARLEQLYQLDDPERIAKSIQEGFTGCPDPAITSPAIQMLLPLITLRDSYKPMAPERVKAARPMILKALDAGEGRPGIAALRGLLLKAEGNAEAALKEFDKELEVLGKAERKTWGSAGWIAKAAKEMDNEPLLVRASQAQLDALRKRSEEYVDYGGEDSPNPALTIVVHHGKGGRFADLYQAVRGVRFNRGFGILWDPANRVPRIPLGEGLMAAAREEKDPAMVRWFVDMILKAEPSSGPSPFGFDALPFLDRIRELEPDNIENLQRLAGKQAAAGSDEAAIRTANEILAKTKAPGRRRGAWTPAEAAVFIAERQLSGGKKKEALATLNDVDWDREEIASWILWKAADLYEAQGDLSRAAALLSRTEENGHKPFLRLAEIAIERQDWVEALRQANRARLEGFSAYVLGPNQHVTREQWEAQAREKAPLELRDAIFKKAGELYFIDRLIASKLPSLTEEETARAHKALKALDEGTIPEREAALKEFSTLGPASAPILRKMLAEGDSLWRTAARDLLQSWAEPR